MASEVSIIRVVGLGSEGTTPAVLYIFGASHACPGDAIGVGVKCADTLESTAEVEQNGYWVAAITGRDNLRRAGCIAGGRVEVEAVCRGDPSARATFSGRIEAANAISHPSTLPPTPPTPPTAPEPSIPPSARAVSDEPRPLPAVASAGIPSTPPTPPTPSPPTPPTRE